MGTISVWSKSLAAAAAGAAMEARDTSGRPQSGSVSALVFRLAIRPDIARLVGLASGQIDWLYSELVIKRVLRVVMQSCLCACSLDSGQSRSISCARHN